jgi:REP element-mobilizing transposase RayT
VTKYQRGVFTAQILRDLRSVFASVCLDCESQLVEFDGEDAHVDLLVKYPPKIAVAALVRVVERPVAAHSGFPPERCCAHADCVLSLFP